jgi:hypothetical protein
LKTQIRKQRFPNEFCTLATEEHPSDPVAKLCEEKRQEIVGGERIPEIAGIPMAAAKLYGNVAECHVSENAQFATTYVEEGSVG